ncbi:MAG: exo-alpha-sialidase [Verrucomicrobia bacterium]|nr:exo-alpha-sialidase [Verrucomicrobiota bacterium]
MKRILLTAVVLSFASLPSLTPAAVTAEVLEVKKIWDAGRHNAFTDLLRWREQWWCVFREADDHVGGDGGIRVLVSADGTAWRSAARLTEPGIDLRDPKLSVTPAGKLMLNCGGSVYGGTKVLKSRQSRVLFSDDGSTWTAPRPILTPGEWMWRVTWHNGVAYGAAYDSKTASNAPSGPEWLLNLYRSTDGIVWELVKKMDVTGRPNETTLRFEPDGTMLMLVRREGDDRLGHIGRAKPPYQSWTWQATNHRFGGQNALRLPGGEWLVGTRDYTGITKGTAGSRTLLAQLQPDGKLASLAKFPSDGDTSYPGMVFRDGQLWFSYYSSHEGKTSIYLAKVAIRGG